MDPSDLTARIKEQARQAGFTRIGVCRADGSTQFDRFQQWLAAGYAGQMHYLPERADAYRHPDSILAGVQSVVMLAMNYHTASASSPQAGQGRVARYAWGEVDYHDLIHDRLRGIADMVRQQTPAAKVRGVVDTAPLLEREFAQRAGLGWIGKNTLLLNQELGSWFFLAALLIDLPLEYDPPQATDHCGTCRACLDACPTDAFPEPYVLDATRCISYLTIELREAIPELLRNGIGDWLFGCDVCQEVCPWNNHAPLSEEQEFQPQSTTNPIDLLALLELDDEAFRARFRRTPLWRSKRRGILRNAAIVLGNHPADAALPALLRRLDDDEPLIRGACAWALGHYPRSQTLEALQERLATETDDGVREELTSAIERLTNA